LNLIINLGIITRILKKIKNGGDKHMTLESKKETGPSEQEKTRYGYPLRTWAGMTSRQRTAAASMFATAYPEMLIPEAMMELLETGTRTRLDFED